MRQNARTLLAVCRRHLGLRLPVRVNIYEGTDTPQGWDGSHIIKRRKFHLIEIARQPSRKFNAILAHELCHAFVDEKYPEAEAHGQEFQEIASDLQYYLTGADWPMEDIFILGLDD